MTKQQKILTMTAIGVAILVIIVLLLLINKRQNAIKAVNTTAGGNNANSTYVNINTGPKVFAAPTGNTNGSTAVVVAPVVDSNLAIKQLSFMFVERFGSYSNQGGTVNIADLKPLMTAAMAKWADDFIKSVESKNKPTDPYAGVTTRALVADVKNFIENNAAEVLVSTERIEYDNNGEKAKYYQDIAVKILYQGDEWKVDSIKWQAKK